MQLRDEKSSQAGTLTLARYHTLQSLVGAIAIILHVKQLALTQLRSLIDFVPSLLQIQAKRYIKRPEVSL